MKHARLFLAAIVACGLLSACGTRGSLEPPEGAPRQPSDQPVILDKLL